jgi:hypothetical protein
MDTERAKQLNEEVVSTIKSSVTKEEYEKVWINMGKNYLPAVDGIEDAVDVPVDYIEGSGIGMKGKQLKQLISTNQAVPVHGD